MQRIIIIVGILLLLFTSFPLHFVEAENIPASTPNGDNLSANPNDTQAARRTKNLLPNHTACPRFMGDEEIYDKIDDFRENRAQLKEEYTLGFAEWIWNLFGLNTLNTLIYGNPFCIWFDSPNPPELVYGLYPQAIKDNVVDPLFNMFTGIFFVALMISMMISGLKMTSNVISGSNFSIVREMGMYLVAGMTLIGFWMGIDYLFMLNWSIVGALNDLLEGQGMSLGQVVLVASIDEFQYSDILILLAEWVLMLFLNLAYILRLFVITALLCVGGLIIIGLLFESTRKYFKIWLLALTGAIFMQSIHALYFTFVLLFISLNEASFLFKMMLLIMFLPLSSMLLGMMAMSDANIANTAAQRMVNMAAKGSRLLGKARKAPAFKQKDMADLSKTRISSLAAGGNGWNMMKSSVKTAGTIAGMTAGSVIGGGGAALGGQLGGAVAGGAMQVPRNVAAGIKSFRDTKENFKGANISENIGERRAYYGQMGEALGSMVGQGSVGRTIGEVASGVSSQRLLNSTELGGFGGVTMQDVMSKYPDATIQFQQTNEGSAFFLNQSGELQAISPVGAADNNLPDGITRTVDYQYTDSFNPSEAPNLESLQSPSILSQMSDVRLNDANGQFAKDNGFDASRINPDDYYSKGNPTADTRTLSDRMADLVGRYKGGESQ